MCTGDFNADGHTDISWRNSNNGDFGTWLNGTASTGYAFLATERSGWQVIGTRDFNADGMSDVIWRNSTTGDCSIWLMIGPNNGSSVFLATMPVAWTIAH